ncbi:MAG: hypothetical protein P8X90_06300 [Desulfobacterales bacterium]|jgi:hypothetical protein
MNTKLKWIIAVLFCTVLAAIALPRFFHSRDLPEKLHGVWETTEAKYSGRYFVLEKNAVGFGTEDGTTDWYEITRVDEVVERNQIVYTIEFQNVKGSVFKKYLYYDSEDGGKIRFKNQPAIEWILESR